ncbi:uncharacterized protein LOC122884814 [Siniperca chuatsi]|uniref:uncharacterized protein LOC122884814 n=1 Tax=Siniperca chuatsi TaxID=119488 RepID=UPI001CE0BB72|nr:uncharacterized protein LOC122884814 [Siniperca chuatsi]
MMKTLCVAVVVLSLTSVCQPVSLACEKLLKPEDKGPDLSGIWYFIAMSSQSCWVPTLLNTVAWPSVRVNITSKDTPNIYNARHDIKIYGYCSNYSDTFLYQNNAMFDVDSDNAPSGEQEVLLQTGCPDCHVVKSDEFAGILVLFSRRKTVTAAELKEFETQTECLGWSKPQVFNSDHNYENCPLIDDDNIDASGLPTKFFQRLKNTYTEPLKCLAENLLYYPSVAYNWAQQGLANIWPF